MLQVTKFRQIQSINYIILLFIIEDLPPYQVQGKKNIQTKGQSNELQEISFQIGHLTWAAQVDLYRPISYFDNLNNQLNNTGNIHKRPLNQ